ncbi:MAG: hypothetical protein ABIR79_23850 [Candidatus Binatia bacterium]
MAELPSSTTASSPEHLDVLIVTAARSLEFRRMLFSPRHCPHGVIAPTKTRSPIA